MRLHLYLYDESGVTPAGTAIYSLADPREVRVSRYIGQTAQPARRLMQHLRTARLGLPDETHWWVAAPRSIRWRIPAMCVRVATLARRRIRAAG